MQENTGRNKLIWPLAGLMFLLVAGAAVFVAYQIRSNTAGETSTASSSVITGFSETTAPKDPTASVITDATTATTAVASAVTTASSTTTSAATQPRQKSLLVYYGITTAADGFQHQNSNGGASSAGGKMITGVAQKNGFEIEFSNDPNVFSQSSVANFDAVLFLSTDGTIFDSSQRTAFQAFIESGKGFIGVHGASATEREWDWYRQLVGARFVSHSPVTSGTVTVTDPNHPTTKGLPSTWNQVDEWYDFELRDASDPLSYMYNVQPLLQVEGNSYQHNLMSPYTHPLAWHQNFGGSRSWYTALGHTPELYSQEPYASHLEAGILWGLGIT